MSGENARKILEDLIQKYEMLSRKIESGFKKLSPSQLVRQIDSLARLAKLILSYRSILELEEREIEFTRILSELRSEVKSGKQAMRAVKKEGGRRIEYPMLLEKILSELKRIRLTLMEGGGDE